MICVDARRNGKWPVVPYNKALPVSVILLKKGGKTWGVSWLSGSVTKFRKKKIFPPQIQSVSVEPYLALVSCKQTRDAGSQYRCGRSGRGSEPPSAPNSPRNPLPTQTHTQKTSKTLVFPLFDWCSRTNRQTGRRTNRPMDQRTNGQSLL